MVVGLGFMRPEGMMMYHGGGPRFEIGQMRPPGPLGLNNFSPGVAAVVGTLKKGEDYVFRAESGKE